MQFTTPCPPIKTIVHIELRSKDNLKGFVDNYLMPGPGGRLTLPLSTSSFPSDVYKSMPGQAFGSRTYVDSYKQCPDCGRRIFEEQ